MYRAMPNIAMDFTQKKVNEEGEAQWEGIFFMKSSTTTGIVQHKSQRNLPL